MAGDALVIKRVLLASAVELIIETRIYDAQCDA
jgi:hypothetical protein